MRGAGKNALRWFARVGTASNKSIHYFSRLRPASDIAAGSCTKGAAEVVVPANESSTIQLTTGASLPVPVVGADAKVEPGTQVNHVPPVPDQHEIQRRRDLISLTVSELSAPVLS